MEAVMGRVRAQLSRKTTAREQRLSPDLREECRFSHPGSFGKFANQKKRGKAIAIRLAEDGFDVCINDVAANKAGIDEVRSTRIFPPR
jgi:hypothetical protein